jgi:hypothetical protein
MGGQQQPARSFRSCPRRDQAIRDERRRHVGEHGQPLSTYYYVTFELDDGERREFSVDGNDYGMLVEQDGGMLTHQGTRYHGFERNRR